MLVRGLVDVDLVEQVLLMRILLFPTHVSPMLVPTQQRPGVTSIEAQEGAGKACNAADVGEAGVACL